MWMVSGRRQWCWHVDGRSNLNNVGTTTVARWLKSTSVVAKSWRWCSTDMRDREVLVYWNSTSAVTRWRRITANSKRRSRKAKATENEGRRRCWPMTEGTVMAKATSVCEAVGREKIFSLNWLSVIKWCFGAFLFKEAKLIPRFKTLGTNLNHLFNHLYTMLKLIWESFP